MNYTNELVNGTLSALRLNTEGTPEEKRERLAAHYEKSSPLTAWEIRKQLPWIQMTRVEAGELAAKYPDLMQVPGFQNVLKFGN